MSEVRPGNPTITIRAEVLLADPDTCKFTVSRIVHSGGPFFFDRKEQAGGSPLAERLFALPGVSHVLVAESVVTVGKESTASWSELKSAIGTAIRTQLLAGVPAILESPRNANTGGRSDAKVRSVVQQPRDPHASIELTRDCEATIIPGGQEVTLAQGDCVVLKQALGGSFTVRTEMGYLVRIAAHDADALGLEGEQANEDPVATGPFELQQVIETLKTVFDPEIPVNVVDLGLVYGCEAHLLADGGHRVEIKMSMTAPGCGMGDVLKRDARTKVQALAGVTEVDVEIVWEPPWDASRMSEAAQLQLGIF